MCSFHGSLPLKACQKASLSSAPVSACHRSMVNSTSLLLPYLSFETYSFFHWLAYRKQRAQKKTTGICDKERSYRNRTKSLRSQKPQERVEAKQAAEAAKQEAENSPGNAPALAYSQSKRGRGFKRGYTQKATDLTGEPTSRQEECGHCS